MSSFFIQLRERRHDISDWLFHFTKGSSDDISRDNLRSILTNGLRQGASGMCFTEAPILSYVGMFDIFYQHDRPMYSRFGLAVRKEWLFARGGRPVIYLPADQKHLLGVELHWLFQEYHPRSQQWAWLREWRCPQPELTLNRDDVLVIVPTEQDAEYLSLVDIDVDLEADVDGGFFVDKVSTFDWWYVTFAELDSAKRSETSDVLIARLLKKKGR
jgi:hypothetical protein